MSTTILAIGAHLDDAFIGAGGVLLQAVRAGSRVVIVTVVSDFSSRAKTKGQEQATIEELMDISRRFGFEHRLLGHRYHRVGLDDLTIKRRLSEIALEVKPDVGFIHHRDDHWPDHEACAKLGHDALLFTHGLTSDLTPHHCPLIYAFDLTPIQTYHFEPDAFYDVADVIDDYMKLILAVDACGNRAREQDLIQARFDPSGDGKATIPLSGHGMQRLADCIRFGDMSGCRFALGFRTVWGRRRGPALWSSPTT